MNENRMEKVFVFDEFSLDARRRALYRDGKQVALNAKSFDLLLHLVENSGAVATKDELLASIWPDQFVEENNLSVQISALRKALGESKDQRNYIVTVPGKGYKFVAPVEIINASDDIIIEQRTIERVIVEQVDPPPPQQLQLAGKTAPRWPLIAAAALLIALIGGGIWWWGIRRVPANIDSIAVMPFTYEGGNADSDFLSDGMTESLINSLSRLPNLTVKARYSVFSYKGKEIVPANVARELSVQALLLGRIVERGDQITLNLELVDAATGNHLWGETYMRNASEISTLQTDISRDVADKLRTKIAGNSTLVKGQTNNAEAFQLYQKARFFWNKRRQEDHEKAIELYQQALRLDPNFALAYAGLGDVYTVDSYRPENIVDRDETGRRYALKALEIEPELAEPYAVLAKIEWNRRDPVSTERDFRRAIEINPNYASARQWHGEFLSQHGRHDAARSELDRAMELDPLSLVIMSDSAWTYYQAGDYSSCIRQTDRTLEFEQTWKAAIGAKIGCYEALGDFEAALDSYALLIPTEKSDADRKRLVEDIDYVRKLTRTDGAKGYWRAYLEIERRKPAEQQEHLFLATCLTQLGDLEGALVELEKAVETDESSTGTMKVEPMFAPLHDQPRFQAMLVRLGLNTEF
ncbi:MAG: winged helix-turn-helix domain-containing protein [Chloracidobacterium sp.]|nr:winged helix-turn-helix domain-containing protein [Chloracidobacterium sp.]